ncbi:hypothetical protein ABZ319_04120 [Nocardia sp. NPDC005978]|uniref:hypothetical protein n=1 Tax=Nocardia sp. NPDC005978 TaxID=3156725 RepID=UPI0033A5890D
MVFRLLLLNLPALARTIPKTVWIAVTCLLVCCGPTGLLLGFVGVTASQSADFVCQCDAALGPDKTSTCQQENGRNHSRQIPTANPYAELSFSPTDDHVPDRAKACAQAMRNAPYQLAPINTLAVGRSADCANRLALELTRRTTATAHASDSDSAQWAATLRDIIHTASLAPLLGSCEQVSSPHIQGSCAGTSATAPITSRRSIALPATVKDQALCGQIVDPCAVSPGDLVFWAFENDEATRVGIAVRDDSRPGRNSTTCESSESTTVQVAVVSFDITTGITRLFAIPPSVESRIKRVLPSE